MAEKDYVKAFRYDKKSHHVQETPLITSEGQVGNVRAGPGMPGGFSSLSANIDHDAILWVSYPLGNAQNDIVPGRLVALEANTLGQLWFDDGGYQFAKFTPPTIADGKVFRATFSGKVVVYGLLQGRRPQHWWNRWINALLPPKVAPAPPQPGEKAAVEAKYRLAGGKNGLLGTPASEPQPTYDAAGSWYQDFRGVVLGPPPSIVSVRPTPGYKIPTCSHFQSGSGTSVKSSIYWTRKTGAHIVAGEIREAWLKMGGPKSALGFPVSDEEPTPDGTGRMSQFEHGQISWYTDNGASVRPDRPTKEDSAARTDGTR
jgi:uncharacterized protein with LGFP repeats